MTGWILAEFARAKARSEKIPAGSRPVVTTAFMATRKSELAARTPR